MLELSVSRILRTTLSISVLAVPLQSISAHAGIIDNTAIATGTSGGVSFESPPSTASVITEDVAASFIVEKNYTYVDNDSSGTLSSGDLIEFEITLENDGNVSLVNVDLIDTFTQDGVTLSLTSGPTLTSGDAVDPNVLNVDEIWTYSASYVLQGSNVDNGNDLENVAAFTAETVGGDEIDGSDTAIVEIDPVPGGAFNGLSVLKTAGTSTARLGDTIRYTITVANDFATDYPNTSIVDTLPAGLTYTPNSAEVDGVPTEPNAAGRILTWDNITVPGEDEVVITLSARIGQQGSSAEYTNNVYVEDAVGNRLTETASAVVRVEIDPVFSCSTIIGKVFDDKNRNGVQDAETSPYTPEPGLPGVRLSTVNGLLITTDEYGRYSVPCAALPDSDTGSNFLLKLDTRSLPTGYRVTTENPRTVRVTQGKMTTLNFGAAISRVVRIELSNQAFLNGQALPSDALDSGIDQMVDALEIEPSVLRLTYYEDGEGMTLAKERMEEVEKRLRERLRRSQLGVDLWIETRILQR